MIDTHQKQLGNTLLKIANDLRGATSWRASSRS